MRAVVFVVALGFGAGSASAQARFAVVVSGATGGQEYQRNTAPGANDLRSTLVDNLRFDPAAVTVLSETAEPASAATARKRAACACRDRPHHVAGRPPADCADWPRHVRRRRRQVQSGRARSGFRGLGRAAPSAVRARRHRRHDGLELSVHGAPRGTAADRHHRNRLRRTALRHRVPRILRRVPSTDDSSDLDKNARISVWEAFSAASAAVRRHYQQRGQLSTERALLDDNGDGVGARRGGAGRRRRVCQSHVSRRVASRRSPDG